MMTDVRTIRSNKPIRRSFSMTFLSRMLSVSVISSRLILSASTSTLTMLSPYLLKSVSLYWGPYSALNRAHNHFLPKNCDYQRLLHLKSLGLDYSRIEESSYQYERK